MKRFSFDRQSLDVGPGKADYIDADGAEQVVDAHAMRAYGWVVRDTKLAEPLAFCNDAGSASAIVNALNALAGGE